jgi:hypothetical protein
VDKKIRKFSGKEVFEKAFKIKENSYLLELDIEEFSRKFGVDVSYIDASTVQDEEIVKTLQINVNVDQGELNFDNNNNTLEVVGDISFIDGVVKFDRFPQHPDAKVQVLLTSLNQEEIRGAIKEC